MAYVNGILVYVNVCPCLSVYVSERDQCCVCVSRRINRRCRRRRRRCRRRRRMALTAVSLSSLSSSTIKIGGTVEAITTTTKTKIPPSTTTATTTTTTTTTTGPGIVDDNEGRKRESDEKIDISSDSCNNLSDSITQTTISASASISTSTSAPTTTTAITTTRAIAGAKTVSVTLATDMNRSMNSIGQLSSTTDDILLDELSSRFRGVLPIQPSPLLLPSDHISSSLKSTRLNGHLIYCFVIGGECRLCFPQIISVVLRDVAINEINELFVNLNIHISVASQQQLDTLKLAGVMPMTADSCGLVTKSDAERLVAKLLPQCRGYRLATTTTTTTAAATTTAATTTTTAAAAATTTTTTAVAAGAVATTTTKTLETYGANAIPVMHDCFDGCTGTLIPMLDTDEQIECNQCKLLFTGEKFVAHSHSIQQMRRICHWGFDSSNWRHYLHLPESCEDDLKALQKLELYKYPPIRLGKRSASHAFTAVENGNCSKVANLSTTTTSVKSVETEAAAGVGIGVDVGVGVGIDPVVPISSVQSLNEFSEHLLKLCKAAQMTVAGTTALTVPSATVTQDASFLPLQQVPVIGTNGCYTGQLSGATSLISPQLQSLLALQFVTSQLPLTEPYRLPIHTNPSSSHITSDIRWKQVCEMQRQQQSSTLPSSSSSSSSSANCNKAIDDMKCNVVVAGDGVTSSKSAQISSSSSTNLDIPPTCTTSKTEAALERLLDQTLKEPVLSVAKLLIMEFRREKDVLLNQNGQLRRENALLRSALASSTVLVGLKGLTAANVPIS